MSSRQEQKAAARAAREEAERKQSAEAQRRRRMITLGGVLAVAVAVAVVLVVVVGGGGSSSSKVPKGGEPAPGGAEAFQLLGGIPQSGFNLGSTKAPLTLVEFADLQCPVCKQYTTDVFPTLVRQYVRTGKLRMQLRLQSFIGPDSVKAGKAVAAAAQQDAGWTFADIFYANQGTENSGYVTDDFLRSIAAATPGLDVSQLFKAIGSPASAQALKTGEQEFNARGFTGTPSFLIGKTGGDLSVLRWSQLTPDQFTGPIDSLLGK